MLQSSCSAGSLSVWGAFLKLLLGWLGSKLGSGSSCRHLAVQRECWEGPQWLGAESRDLCGALNNTPQECWHYMATVGSKKAPFWLIWGWVMAPWWNLSSKCFEGWIIINSRTSVLWYTISWNTLWFYRMCKEYWGSVFFLKDLFLERKHSVLLQVTSVAESCLSFE